MLKGSERTYSLYTLAIIIYLRRREKSQEMHSK
jgi:hypothetical protein